MWRCKHVADALAESHYDSLPWLKRVGLKVHVALCVVCGRYHRQVMVMQEMAEKFRDHEALGDLPEKTQLSPDAKRRMKDAMKALPN